MTISIQSRPSPESTSLAKPGLILYCEDCEARAMLPVTWRLVSSRRLILQGSYAYDMEPVGYEAV